MCKATNEEERNRDESCMCEKETEKRELRLHFVDFIKIGSITSPVLG